MRKTLIMIIAVQVLNANFAYADLSDIYIDPYYRQDGTKVEGHYRTFPDNIPYNNYSFPGNTNPYTNELVSPNQCSYEHHGVTFNTPQCRNRAPFR